MKKLVIIAALISTLPAFAFSAVRAYCESDRGVGLEIEMSTLESLPPPHLLTLIHGNRKILSNELIREIKSPNYDVAFIGRHPVRSDVEIFVGVDAVNEEVVYQESANNGMSPLPATFFKNCVVEVRR